METTRIRSFLFIVLALTLSIQFSLVSCTEISTEYDVEIEDGLSDFGLSGEWHHVSDVKVEKYLEKFEKSNEHANVDMYDSLYVERNLNNTIVVIPANLEGKDAQWFYASNDSMEIDYFISFKTSVDWLAERPKNDDNIDDWTGQINVFSGDSSVDITFSYDSGELVSTTVECNSEVFVIASDGNEEGEFVECLEDAWETLPLWWQAFCVTACGSCLWSGNPYGCGSCVGCMGGMATHCLFIED